MIEGGGTGRTEHGIDGNEQRAKADGGVALPERAHHDKQKAGAGEPNSKQPGPREQVLHAKAGKQETGQRHGQILNSPEKVIIGLSDSPSHYAKREQYHDFQIASGD